MTRMLCLLALFTFPALADSCQTLYQQHLATDMTLSYQQFDQTMGQGFRPLVANKCYPQAAELIAQYIAKTHHPQSSLVWHLAQMQGLSGHYQAAITNANKVLISPEQQAASALDWNDFVHANIAFWQRNKKQLLHFREQLAMAEKIKPNIINLRYLDRLISHFDKPYADIFPG
ncbi:hypothetical protein [Gallaecimonas mangrovi]|uniref:hypothetical protein n=1 Tax=Gallaecimonas mangrovi TaxID=2291597 RepID=UPI001260223B|nr:hypothetical protein [Gallaecimonas mangrovi]